MADLTPREKCRVMVVKLVEASLDDHYAGEGHKERCKNVLALDAFAHLKENPNAPKINDFMGSLMQKLAKECWEAKKAEVLSIIDVSLGGLIDELLTEDEASELYAFGTSPTGQKVFRNLDLMKNAIARGRNIMSGDIIAAWSHPSVADQIDEYIESLES